MTRIEPCPHCGQPFSVSHGDLQRHAPKCIFEPNVFAATKAALSDGNGRIISQRSYEVLPRTLAVCRSTLADRIGTWSKVAKVFGLVYIPRPHGKPAGFKAPRVLRALDMPLEDDLVLATGRRILEDEEEQRILAEEAQRAVCLHACRMIDAGHEVRYVLR